MVPKKEMAKNFDKLNDEKRIRQLPGVEEGHRQVQDDSNCLASERRAWSPTTRYIAQPPTIPAQLSGTLEMSVTGPTTPAGASHSSNGLINRLVAPLDYPSDAAPSMVSRLQARGVTVAHGGSDAQDTPLLPAAAPKRVPVRADYQALDPTQAGLSPRKTLMSPRWLTIPSVPGPSVCTHAFGPRLDTPYRPCTAKAYRQHEGTIRTPPSVSLHNVAGSKRRRLTNAQSVNSSPEGPSRIQHRVDCTQLEESTATPQKRRRLLPSQESVAPTIRFRLTVDTQNRPPGGAEIQGRVYMGTPLPTVTQGDHRSKNTPGDQFHAYLDSPKDRLNQGRMTSGTASEPGTSSPAVSPPPTRVRFGIPDDFDVTYATGSPPGPTVYRFSGTLWPRSPQSIGLSDPSSDTCMVKGTLTGSNGYQSPPSIGPSGQEALSPKAGSIKGHLRVLTNGRLYTILVRDRRTGEWGTLGGYSHLGENRNYTAARELGEETNHTLNISPHSLNFGSSWDKPFKTFLEIVENYGTHLHRHVEFVIRTNDFQHHELRQMVEKMRHAPHQDGYRETTGMAFVEMGQIIMAGMSSHSDAVWVKASQGYVFDYDRKWEAVHSVRDQYIKLRSVFKRSLSSHLARFQQLIAEAQFGPVLVHHH